MNEKFFEKVEKVFGTECEKYVVGLVLHASADEAELTLDAGGIEPVDKDQAFELLVRGAVIKCGTAYYKPIKFEETAGYLTVTTAGDTDAKVFYTSEKSA